MKLTYDKMVDGVEYGIFRVRLLNKPKLLVMRILNTESEQGSVKLEAWSIDQDCVDKNNASYNGSYRWQDVDFVTLLECRPCS